VLVSQRPSCQKLWAEIDKELRDKSEITEKMMRIQEEFQLAAGMLDKESAGPGRCCSPSHATRFAPSMIKLRRRHFMRCYSIEERELEIQ
jgi:hypothetical protein